MSAEFDKLSYREKCVYFMKNREWYYYEDDFAEDPGFPLLTDKAPPLAVESYNFAKAMYEESLRTGVFYD